MQPMEAPSRKQRLVGALAGAPHRWQPTTSLVLEMMSNVGFERGRACTFLEGDLPDLAAVEHRDESLFVEAER